MMLLENSESVKFEFKKILSVLFFTLMCERIFIKTY